MELSKTQKTFIICCSFIIGLAGFYTHHIWAVSILFGIIIASVKYNKILSNKIILLLIASFVFAIFYADFRAPQPDDLYNNAPTRIEIKGTIASVPKQNLDKRTKFEFIADSIKDRDNFKSTHSKTIVSIYDYNRAFDSLQIGDRLELKAAIKRPYDATNPGQFSYKKYLLSHNIQTMASVNYDGYKLIEKPKNGYWYWIQLTDNLRNKMIDTHAKYLKSPNLEILGGVVFGNDAINPPQQVKDDFINSGLYHLLAASGMNVGLIFGIWYFICNAAKLPFRLTIIGGGLLVLVYALMTGFPPSVLRATGMLEFVLLGKLIDREADNITLLALICALILLFNPMTINDVGFQLSFLVTLGLLLCTPIIMSKLDRIPQWLSGWFVVPFVAQLWAAPIQIFHFNTFALYSILANMLVIPFVGIISFCGFIGSIFSLIPTVGEKLCFLTDKIAEPLINALLFISEQASDLPNSLLDIGKPLIIELVLFYILIVALIFAIQKEFESKPRNIAVIALTFALIIFPLFSKLNNKLSFLFFDVGEGDGILISTPNNKLIMVDTGSFERYGYNAAITAIIPYLKDQGIKKLDAIILSHPDSDHIGGTVNLLKNFNTKIIYTNGDSSTTKTYKALEQYIKTNNIQTKIVSNNQKLQIDDAVEITAYKPTNTEDDTFNDTSIVLLIKYKDFAALLTGDSESLAFEQYKDKIIPVNILKVGHHGSYGCLNNKMLDTLKPQISVISVGKNNKHNHPNPQVIKLLNKTNTYTARTDSDNAIKIDTNGKNIQLMKFDTDIQRWKKVRFLK